MPTTETTLNAIGLAPILTVDDLDQSLEFYQRLGFRIEQRYEREGRLVGMMVRAGEARLNLSQDDWAKGRDRAKGIGVRLFIVTDQNVDQLAAQATEAGLHLERETTDMPWGRSFDLTDPDGFKVTVARQVERR